MTNDTNHEELAALWQRYMTQSVETWRAALPQATAAMQAWGETVAQGMAAWTQATGHATATPDGMAQWKKAMDAWVDMWSKAFEEAMATEAFAATMGRSLDQYLNAVGPARRSLQALNDELLRMLDMPSRKQVIDLAARVSAVDERLESADDRLEAIEERLETIQGQLTRALDRMAFEHEQEDRRQATVRAAEQPPAG